jgi:hypothetical protein
MKIFSPDFIHRIFVESALEQVRRIDVFLSLGFAFLLTGLAFWWIPLNDSPPITVYTQFAKNPFRFWEFPYGARMLTPVLVGVLPLDTNAGFRLIALISYILCGTFLTLWLRLSGISLGWALGLLPAFYYASTAKFLIANAWYIDPMSFWILVVTFIGVMTGNIGLTMFSLALGALNRPESLTVIAVLVIAWTRKDRPVRSILTAIFCAAPAVLLYTAIFYIWPLVSDFQVWQELGGGGLKNDPQPYAVIFAQQGFKALLDPKVYRETLPCLWGLSIAGFLQVEWRIRWMAIAQIAIAILPMTIATDYFRLPFYVFPAVIFLSALGVQFLSQIHTAWAWISLAAALLLTALAPQSILGGVTFAAVILGIVIFAKYRRKNPLEASGS